MLTSADSPSKPPTVKADTALIYVEYVFDEAGLEQPDWILVSCES
jgi:hypothetical protein